MPTEVCFDSSKIVLDYHENIQINTAYCAIHVRRGDKLKLPAYPHLDEDTQPERILEILTKYVPKGTTVYILTNEKDKKYFDLLRSKYDILQYTNFPILKQLVENENPDNFLLYEIEKRILNSAKYKIHTFDTKNKLNGIDEEPRIFLARDKI